MNRLSEALSEYRRKNPDVTQEELAERCQISTQMLWKYMRGTVTPRKSTLAMIAAGIGVDVEDLQKCEENVQKCEENVQKCEPEEVSEDPAEEEEETEGTEVHIHVSDQKMDPVRLRETVLLYFFSINDREKRMTTEEICVTADEFLVHISSCLK